MTDNPGDIPAPNARSTAVDVHVGRRIRQRRTILGLSQEKLADALGVTFQQIQKYEMGTDRVCASRLFNLSQALNVSIGYFFDDMAEACVSLAEIPAEPAADPSLKHETLELMRAYHGITDPQVRRQVHELAKALAEP